MVNNREMYCEHCKRTTLFFLESDLLWYCDECGNVAESHPYDESEEEEFESREEEEEEMIRCPFCNNLIIIESLTDGVICPVCYEDLSGELESKGYGPKGEIWD